MIHLHDEMLKETLQTQYFFSYECLAIRFPLIKEVDHLQINEE